MQKRIAVILAAGKGARMHSDLPKVLHVLNGKPMIHHVLQTAKTLSPQRIIVVVGYRHDQVRAALTHEALEFAMQDPQLGTAHALMQTQPLLRTFDENLLVLSGDVPLITPATLSALFAAHEKTDAAATLLTATLDNPAGYGRILRDAQGIISCIVEEKDASPEVKKIKEVNAGIYIFKSPSIFNTLARITSDNAQREYYLPDAITLLASEGKIITTHRLANQEELCNINTPGQLAAAEHALQPSILHAALKANL